MKELARERVFEPAAVIVERVMKDMVAPNDVSLPKPANLVRVVNHHRRLRPDDPKDLAFEVSRRPVISTLLYCATSPYISFNS